MKTIKKLGLFVFAFLAVVMLASCGNKEDNTDVAESELSGAVLSSISVDTTNVKTLYYLGEEFSSEGLKVNVNYLKFNEEENKTEAIKKECTTYYLDLSAVDMSAVGEYQVKVLYRTGNKTVNAQYKIQVKSSIFNESGLEYLSGLEIKYDSNTIKELKLDESYTFNKNLVTATLHTAQMVNGEIVTGTKSVDMTKLSIDYSAVDTANVGTYMVKYTYTGDALYINGQNYENKVVSYTLVNVVNPVVSIEKVSKNDVNFYATTEGLDYSNWNIKITREVARGTETVACTSDLFEITGACSYVVGSSQTVKVTLLEDTTKTIEVNVSIVASKTQDILIGNNFNKDLNNGTTSNDQGRIQLDDSGMFFANFSETNTSKTREENSKAADGVAFSTRVTINTSASFEIVMSKPGVIIVYASSTGDDARELALVDSLGVELGSGFATLKNTPTAFRFNVTEAGTYKVVSLTSTIYVHGCIVATSKN